MNTIKMVLVSALFAVVAACGSDKATVEEACDNACGCAPENERAACEAFCPLGLSGAPQACIDCIADQSCSADEDACDAECPDDEE
jgi:hypothetical protein